MLNDGCTCSLLHGCMTCIHQLFCCPIYSILRRVINLTIYFRFFALIIYFADASGSTSSPDLALESTDLTTHNNSTTINNNSSISNNNSNSNNTINNSSISNSNVKQSALNATYHKSFPSVEFEFYDPDGSTTVAVHT